MKNLHVIKVGGAVINAPHQLEHLLKGISGLAEPFILVHGGGRKVNEWLRKLDLQVNMVDGRRITDGPTLELAVMNYAGSLNKQIVSTLQRYGKNACGLSGADMDCIRAVKRSHPTIDFGFVGDVVQINPSAFTMLIDHEIAPVCCAITHDGNGQLLNTNADTIASEVAKSLAHIYNVHLWFGFEKTGVLEDVNDETSVVRHLDKDRYQTLLAGGKIHDGMKPKLHNCMSALEAGVQSVHICNVEGLLSIPESAGTKITLK